MFCLGHLKERGKKNLEDIVIKGWIIIKWILKKLDAGVSLAWIHLAQGRGKWRFPVYTVFKVSFRTVRGI
jgi:hypothetical protein